MKGFVDPAKPNTCDPCYQHLVLRRDGFLFLCLEFLSQHGIRYNPFSAALQYMALLSSTVSYGAMKARLTASAKDEDITAFSAVDKLLGFEGGRLSINARLDLAMQDADLEPLIVQVRIGLVLLFFLRWLKLGWVGSVGLGWV